MSASMNDVQILVKEDEGEYEDQLRMLYSRTIRFHFPRLLEDPTIPLEDKATIKTLIINPSNPAAMTSKQCGRHKESIKNKENGEDCCAP